jgi:hypothetical protein
MFLKYRRALHRNAHKTQCTVMSFLFTATTASVISGPGMPFNKTIQVYNEEIEEIGTGRPWLEAPPDRDPLLYQMF